MPLYYIKKLIEAKSIKEAIKKEAQADIVDVWTERISTHAIGFTVSGSETD